MQRSGRSPSSDGETGAPTPLPEHLERQLRTFLERYPIDARASDFLAKSPVEVVQAVLSDFKAKREGERDYSALVTNFVRLVRARVDRKLVAGGRGSAKGGSDGGNGRLDLDKSRRRGRSRSSDASRSPREDRRREAEAKHRDGRVVLEGRGSHRGGRRPRNREGSDSSDASRSSKNGGSALGSSSTGSGDEDSDSEDSTSSSLSSSDSAAEARGRIEREKRLERIKLALDVEEREKIANATQESTRVMQQHIQVLTKECEEEARNKLERYKSLVLAEKIEKLDAGTRSAKLDCDDRIRLVEEEAKVDTIHKIREAERELVEEGRAEEARIVARRKRRNEKTARRKQRAERRKKLREEKKVERRKDKGAAKAPRHTGRKDAIGDEDRGRRRGGRGRRRRREDRRGRSKDVRGERGGRRGERQRRGALRGESVDKHKERHRCRTHRDHGGDSRGRETGGGDHKRHRGDRSCSSSPGRGPRESELRAFRDRYPMDDKAWSNLTSASAEVQRAVISQFKPKSEGDADYSALVATFCRAVVARRAQTSGTGVARPRATLRPANDCDGSAISVFRNRYPMDDRAYSCLERSTQQVQDLVIADFRPRREGEADYSALVMSFVRAVQTRVASGGGVVVGGPRGKATDSSHRSLSRGHASRSHSDESR